MDWDHAGTGSRVIDLSSILFDLHRLHRDGATTAASGGSDLIIRHIDEVAGEDGLRCVISYAAIARLALSALHRHWQDVWMWEQVTTAVLDCLPMA